MKFPGLNGRIGLLVFAVAVVLAGTAWLAYERYKAKPVVRIGVLHSLTGTMAMSETPLVDALRLAVEEANQSGGVNGAQIEMVVADCHSDAKVCAVEAERLITQEKVVALFGCWTSSCRKAVKPVVEKHDRLLFYSVQYEGLEQSPDIVYTGAVPNQQLIPMMNWAMRKFGKRAYLIGSDYVFPRTANGIARKLLQALDGVMVAERYVPLGSQDMDDVARDIAARHPDFVLNTLNGDSNRSFFRALKQAGVSAKDIPVFSTSLAEAELANIGPEWVAGHYAAWNYFQSVGSDDNRAFVERFRRRFGSDRVLDDPMESSYVAVKLWVQAVRNCGSVDTAVVRTQLGTDSLSMPEGIVSVDSDTLHVWKTVRIGLARPDGQFDIVWQSPRAVEPAPYPYFIPRVEQVALSKLQVAP